MLENVASEVRMLQRGHVSTQLFTLNAERPRPIEDEHDDDQLQLIRHPRSPPPCFEVVGEFEQVPSEFLQSERWALVSTVKWVCNESILILVRVSAIFRVFCVSLTSVVSFFSLWTKEAVHTILRSTPSCEGLLRFSSSADRDYFPLDPIRIKLQ